MPGSLAEGETWGWQQRQFRSQLGKLPLAAKRSKGRCEGIRTLGAAKADANARLRPSLNIADGLGFLKLNAAD
jgi:hypothetical protein